MADAPADAAALAEWCELAEELIRGLVHSLNNRLTAMSAFSELAALGDAEFAVERVMPAEIARMERVTALLRLLVSDDTPAEALEVTQVLEEAVALHAHHPILRAVRCEVRRDDGVLPVRAPRWALLRLLLVLVESATRAAAARGDEHVEVRLDGDERQVTVRVDGAVDSPAARAMAARCGASVRGDAGGAIATLPSLPEQRRLEREARG